MDQSAVPLTHAIIPHALVDGAVCVLHCPEAMPYSFASTEPRNNHEFTFVDISRAICVRKLEKLVDLLLLLRRCCFSLTRGGQGRRIQDFFFGARGAAARAASTC